MESVAAPPHFAWFAEWSFYPTRRRQTKPAAFRAWIGFPILSLRHAERAAGRQGTPARRRRRNDGAVFEQHAVWLTPRAVKLHLDAALNSKHLLGRCRAASAGARRTRVDHRLSGRVIGDRHRLDHREGDRPEPVHGDAVA